MPLMCLQEIRDPDIYSCVVDFACRYGSEVAIRYCYFMRKPIEVFAFPLGRKPKGFWDDFVRSRLTDGHVSWEELTSGLTRNEKHNLYFVLHRMQSQGLIKRTGKSRKPCFVLIK